MRIVSLLLLLAALPAGFAQSPDEERWARYSNLKFGMFIHWGPYSLASVEASWPIMQPARPGISEADYRALPAKFNPVKYDPKAWVRLAKAAGQQYMVFTTKHHDGFCMFDSAFTSYKITSTPYKKDVVAMLAAACREENMPLGFYYSPPDMNHPGYRDTSQPSTANWRGEPARAEWALYLQYMELQVRELLTRYGDVLVMWFDGLIRQGDGRYDPYRFFKMIRELQPRTLINARLGLPGDFDTPEQRVPKEIPGRTPHWETCMTINGTWAYNQNDRRFKSVTQLIQTLADVASKGGNFLLNVGPTSEGTIQPEFEERLKAMGAWLKTNGESIYGTTAGPLQGLAGVRTTAKGRTFYLHVFDWPKGSLRIEGIRTKVAKVSLLADKRAVSFQQQGYELAIQVPAQAPDPHDTVFAIETR